MRPEEYDSLGSDFETDSDTTTQNDRDQSQSDQTIGEVGQGETFGEQIPREDNLQPEKSDTMDNDDPLKEDYMVDEDI